MSRPEGEVETHPRMHAAMAWRTAARDASSPGMVRSRWRSLWPTWRRGRNLPTLPFRPGARQLPDRRPARQSLENSGLQANRGKGRARRRI